MGVHKRAKKAKGGSIHAETKRSQGASSEDRNPNWEFRTFLKGCADDDELDAQFLALHNELFAHYDCCRCANCCRAYKILLNDTDIARISAHLGMYETEFHNKYLESYENDDEGHTQYVLKEKPCCFLAEDGRCRIQAVKPAVCAGYPFTNKPNRLCSMMGVIEFAETCPIVFEILERLKATYQFRPKKR
jgi:Fe-S-cluster containining protein